MHALIRNGEIVRYPYTMNDLRKDNPSTSYPPNMTEQQLAELGMFIVYNTPAPEVAIWQVLELGHPQFNPANQRWEQTWVVRDRFQEFTNEQGQVVTVQQQIDDAIAANQQAAAERLKEEVVQNTQKRLDEFARTRLYDSILSACTYATSTIPKFKSEGQYCVDARDATWAKLYQILDEVQAGTRPAPSGYADVEAELPVLAWPNTR